MADNQIRGLILVWARYTFGAGIPLILLPVAVNDRGQAAGSRAALCFFSPSTMPWANLSLIFQKMPVSPMARHGFAPVDAGRCSSWRRLYRLK